MMKRVTWQVFRQLQDGTGQLCLGTVRRVEDLVPSDYALYGCVVSDNGRTQVREKRYSNGIIERTTIEAA